MLPVPVAEVARGHQFTVARLVQIALQLLAGALIRGFGSPAVWRDAVALLAPRLIALQIAAAALAEPYLDAVLTAQGADTTAEAHVNADGFADMTDGGGSWMRLLVFAPNSVADAAKPLVATSIVANGLQDTARSAAQAAMQCRPAVRSYVRMLNPPSCDRCAILAGRVYHRMTAFQRHPRCDCINVPSATSTPDWTTSPDHYFRSLTTDQQDTTFGAAAARAIRDGADISQIVNAESGMSVVTARSLAGQRLGLRRGQTGIRLLPDEIYQLADLEGWSRAEVLRQLHRAGYLI